MNNNIYFGVPVNVIVGGSGVAVIVVLFVSVAMLPGLVAVSTTVGKTFTSQGSVPRWQTFRSQDKALGAKTVCPGGKAFGDKRLCPGGKALGAKTACPVATL